MAIDARRNSATAKGACLFTNLGKFDDGSGVNHPHVVLYRDRDAVLVADRVRRDREVRRRRVDDTSNASHGDTDTVGGNRDGSFTLSMPCDGGGLGCFSHEARPLGGGDLRVQRLRCPPLDPTGFTLVVRPAVRFQRRSLLARPRLGDFGDRAGRQFERGRLRRCGRHRRPPFDATRETWHGRTAVVPGLGPAAPSSSSRTQGQ